MNEYSYTMLIIKVETGRVDGQRLCVTGESAGGFTTLACLAFRQTFKAGSSLYGASFKLPYILFLLAAALVPAKNLYASGYPMIISRLLT